MRKIAVCQTTLLCLFYFVSPAQVSPPDSLHSSPVQFLNKVSDRALNVLSYRYSLLNRLVEKHAEKALQRMEKKELDLQRNLMGQLHGADSARAAGLFAGTEARYQQMLSKLRAGISSPVTSAGSAFVNPLKDYLPRVDSMQTALRFLSQPGVAVAGQEAKVQALSQKLQQLQGSLQNASDLQTYFSGRERQLKAGLTGTGPAKQLLGINQEAYYYQEQVSQYKNMLNDPDKIQQAVLSAVEGSAFFQHFWQKNSYWSVLFPAQLNNDSTPRAIAGLQTREQLQEDVQKRLGITASQAAAMAAKAGGSGGGGSSGGGEGGVGGAASYLQSQMQNVQNQLSALKQRLGLLGGGSSGGNMTMPDFQPNSQHNKTFLKRIEYSFTIQNSASTALLPAISNVGFNLGYKFSDKIVAGVGGSYLLGLGYGLEHIRLSNQGIGYRVFGDIKAKGSIWITGGLEDTYTQQFASLQTSRLQTLRHIDVWQKSALIGLTKKYKIGSKGGEMQLLYDLLARQEVPAGQPLQFRMGWSL